MTAFPFWFFVKQLGEVRNFRKVLDYEEKNFRIPLDPQNFRQFRLSDIHLKHPKFKYFRQSGLFNRIIDFFIIGDKTGNQIKLD